MGAQVPAVVVTPDEIQVGDSVEIDCTGFLAKNEITVTIDEYGFEVQGVTDAAGEFSGDAMPVKASGTLTVSGGLPIAAETVTIGSVTYTWRAAVTTTANEVKIGVDVATSLAALKAAVNDDTSQQSLYGSLTAQNPDVVATALNGGAGTLLFAAIVGGTGGNSLATTETMTHGAFGAGDLAGGAAAPVESPLVFTPTDTRPFTVKATDGTNTASSRELVFTQ